MRFNSHSDLVGRHALLSPSGYHWVNYDEDRLEQMFEKAMTAKRGTELHQLAHDLIRLGVRLPDNQKTLNRYVNDCLGYRLTTEQMLYYSPACFGTADAIGFRRNFLRIFDLKNGVTKTSVKQLEIYAALFCLEYDVKPSDIGYDLRIYQNDGVQRFETDHVEIARIMYIIVSFDKKLDVLRKEAE
jgi:hypothetical protein